MEKMLLWIFFFIGMMLFVLILREPKIKEYLLVFLLTSYISSLIGVIVVEENMLAYPIKFLENHFDSSILFGYLIFPIVNVYFYRTTYDSKWAVILLQALVYATGLTIFEMILEKYTDLIDYISWTWIYTFFSTMVFMLLIRTMIIGVKNKE
jgi:hypothetical protein